jgi:hypothetical protein
MPGFGFRSGSWSGTGSDQKGTDPQSWCESFTYGGVFQEPEGKVASWCFKHRSMIIHILQYILNSNRHSLENNEYSEHSFCLKNCQPNTFNCILEMQNKFISLTHLVKAVSFEAVSPPIYLNADWLGTEYLVASIEAHPFPKSPSWGCSYLTYLNGDCCR